MRYKATAFCLGLVIAAVSHAAPPPDVNLEQIVSREHPAFNCAQASMTIGRDGKVYLSSTIHDASYVLRIHRDGTGQYGGLTEESVNNATANAQGVIATANGHFGRKVVLLDQKLQKIVEVGDFLGDDNVGCDAPIHVKAGAGGDFYGLDQHRSRIVQISPAGKVVRALALPPEPAHSGNLQNFRICEKPQSLFGVSRQPSLKCIDFNGRVRWKIDGGFFGGFDADDNGNLYVIEARDNQVKIYDPAGKEIKRLTLQMGALKPTGNSEAYITGLRVFGNELLIKQNHPTEMFQRYDLATGALKDVAATQHERLGVTYAADSHYPGVADR